MNSVEEILQRFIAEHRISGRVDARPFLDRVSGADRAELAVHIDRYLARRAERPFDPEAFARFRADPLRRAMVERILESTTLEALRKEAGVTKAQVARSLAEALDLPGRERTIKARYHDIERGSVDPSRVRQQIWGFLSDLFGTQVERLREAAQTSFFAKPGDPPGLVYARSVDAPYAIAAREAPQERFEPDEVDLALFEE